MYPIKVISVAQSRYLEEKANEAGLPYAQMMESAGRGAAQAIQRRLGAGGKRIVVLIGPGNNGGDGLVAAHHLQEMSARVTCYIWKRNPQGDDNLQRVQADDIPVIWAEDDADLAVLRGLLLDADVIVDALLGVGVSRPIGGLLGDILAVTRQAILDRRSAAGLVESVPSPPAGPPPLVVAVDCPTGLNCDSGALDPAALPRDRGG